MAELLDSGSILANCPGCQGAMSTYNWGTQQAPFGVVRDLYARRYTNRIVEYRLYQCPGCLSGGLAKIRLARNGAAFPSGGCELIEFSPKCLDRLKLPAGVPDGILSEFREAELCIESGCHRAAAALVRSALEKVLIANGYTRPNEKRLFDKIDAAAKDGTITRPLKKRAHDEVRFLGNDVLHGMWRPVSEESVRAARQYCQRIIEAFYDERSSVEQLLEELNRTPERNDELTAMEPDTTLEET